jgi:molybdopterin-binding protein
MKISARNQLKGTIVDVKLAKGKPATAVIKASDVMVGVD